MSVQMGRPPKTLAALVAGGTFVARKHAERLGQEPLNRLDLRVLQERYVEETDPEAKHALALAFEKIVRSTPTSNEHSAASPGRVDDLEARLNENRRLLNVLKFTAATAIVGARSTGDIRDATARLSEITKLETRIAQLEAFKRARDISLGRTV